MPFPRVFKKYHRGHNIIFAFVLIARRPSSLLRLSAVQTMADTQPIPFPSVDLFLFLQLVVIVKMQ